MVHGLVFFFPKIKGTSLEGWVLVHSIKQNHLNKEEWNNYSTRDLLASLEKEET